MAAPAEQVDLAPRNVVRLALLVDAGGTRRMENVANPKHRYQTATGTVPISEATGDPHDFLTETEPNA